MAPRLIKLATIIAIAIGLLAAPAQAKTYEVTRTGDPAPGPCKPKDCSLREAVIAANERKGRDKVILAKRKRYELTSEVKSPDAALTLDLNATDALTIRHPGKGRATIDANGIDRVIEASETLKLVRITVRGGVEDASGIGGGIYSQQTLRLVRSKVVDNETTDAGGGIFATNESVTINRSVIAGNRATTRVIGMNTIHGDGGGINLTGADLRMRDSTVRNNSALGIGGGIQTFATNDSIKNSTIANNTSGGSGGGIMTFDSVTRISGSTISGNRAVGTGEFLVNGGGGISVNGSSYPDAGPGVALVNSTVAGNRSFVWGGGISVDSANTPGVLRLVNSTVARNVANADEVEDGPGGGLYKTTNGSVTAVNSLIALNIADGAPNDCEGEGLFDSDGGNLVTVEAGCDGFEFGTADLLRAQPKVGPLARNGGHTQTVALRKGSPAIGRAVKPAAPKRDQRGVKRDKRPDIGAYER